MDVFQYHEETGALLGQKEAWPLPRRESLEDGDAAKWQVPRFATLDAPPATPPGEIPCYVDGAWQVRPDYVGATVYDRRSGKPVVFGTDVPNPVPGAPLDPAYSDRSVPFDPAYLDEVKERKERELQAEHDARRYAPVSVTVKDGAHDWHADPRAIENLNAVVTGIAAGLAVADPRPWTPKGQDMPVMVSHAELKAIAQAIIDRADALHVVKKTKELEIKALTDPDDVLAYDVTVGW